MKIFLFLPKTGIEPVRPYRASDFKSEASTNSATSASDYFFSSSSIYLGSTLASVFMGIKRFMKGCTPT